MLPWTNSQLKNTKSSLLYADSIWTTLKENKNTFTADKRGQKLRADVVQQSTRWLLVGLAEAQEGNQMY